MSKRFFALRVAIAAMILFTPASLPAQPAADASLFHFSGKGKVCPQIVPLVEQVGGRVDWGINKLIAYDRLDPETKRFQVWVMKPDGTSSHCVTSVNATLAQIDVGNPAWHPSGNYLIVQAADMAAPPWAAQRDTFYKRITSPGAGYNSDLWIISADGSHAAALTHLHSGQGVLHAHFSHSGDQLLWSELVSTEPQKWVMCLGNFRVDTDGPHLTDIQTLDPLGNAFYETHDFSPDDKQILFSTTKEAGDYKHLNLTRLDLATGKTKDLTEPGADEWNEHAHYSPDGKRIIWASSRGTDQKSELKLTRNDFWIMKADGSDKRRLTYFNEPGAPEFTRGFHVASDSSWSPDGKSFVGYVQSRTRGEPLDSYTGTILRITLP